MSIVMPPSAPQAAPAPPMTVGPSPSPAGPSATHASAAPPALTRPLHAIGFVLLLALVAATIIRWSQNPVRHASIKPAPVGYRINVNTADADTLALLSGISTRIGQYVVNERERGGPFRSAADLDRVPRIGPVTIEKIAPYICFE